MDDICGCYLKKRIGRSFAGIAILSLVHLTDALVIYPHARIAQEYIGYVLEVRGNWLLNDESTPLSVGKKLPAGGKITIKPGDENSAGIVIVNNTGGVLFQRRCRVKGECDQTIQLPPQPRNDKPVWSQIVKATMEILWRESKKFTSFISKGNESMVDGIVGLEDGKIDVSHIFARMPEKEYLLKLKPLLPERKIEPALLSFTWRGENPARIKLDGIDPGLYELQQWNSEYQGPVAEAWVLIVNSADYRKKIAAYQESQPLIDQLRGQSKDGKQVVAKETIRNFLRAYLYSLAESANK